ncbi:MAG: MFS transporter, partial [Chloroflexi bacterium]|nr:MFS transporter [Chloroflexota bacterium]
GKFACGPLADRYGATAAVVATEAVTCAMLLLLPVVPLLAIPLLIGVFGIVLNGTSSVLYASVADFFPAARRPRGYGVYYTLAQTSAAVAPLAYGLLGDRAGLTTLFITLAGLNALTLPLMRLSQRG